MMKRNLNPNYTHLRQTLIEDLEKESNDLHPSGDHEFISYGMNNYKQTYPTEPNMSPISDQTYSDRTEPLESFQVSDEPTSCRMCDIYYKQHRHILFIMYIIIAFLCVLCLILINKIINSNSK